MKGVTPPYYGYGYGFGYSFEYRSPVTIGGWPLLHVCGGIDPETMGVMAAIAMRGCPACWMLGLWDTLTHK